MPQQEVWLICPHHTELWKGLICCNWSIPGLLDVLCMLSWAGFDELAISLHSNSVASTDRSPSNQTLSGSMDCWSRSLDAGDAKKLNKDASISALRIPIPPSPTSNEAWSHWSYSPLRSTFKMLMGPVRKVSSNCISSRFSPHSEFLSRYDSFGIARLFLSITKASWAWRCVRRSTALVRSSILFWMALSCALPLRTGDPRRVIINNIIILLLS